MRFWRKVHNIIDRAWRHTHASILYYFDNRKDEVDIDWLNMHNNIMEKQNERPNKSKSL
jgi:hypothetical protein